jgi:SET domain-containing protein
MGLIIRSSSIHAAGCYTTSSIAKGVKVVEYTGPRISKRKADKRFEDSKITYLFAIGDGSTVINGMGVAMYINHSCDPNCETEEVDGRVWIMSLRSIAPGEELTYDYNLFDGDEDDARCYCGAGNCRKTMYSPEEIARRKKAVRRKALRAAEARSRKAAARKQVKKSRKASSARPRARRK